MRRLKGMWRRKWVRYPAGLVLGGAAGFAYYHFVGCFSGG